MLIFTIFQKIIEANFLLPHVLTLLNRLFVNSGQYLSLNPSTLESLTRSGAEACASRKRKSDFDEAIVEEDGASTDAGKDSIPFLFFII